MPRAATRTGAGAACRMAMLALPLLAGCAALQPAPQARPEPGAVAALDRLGGNGCNPMVARALAGAGVPVARVDGLTYGLYRNIHTGEIEMYDAWLSLRDQPGSIVVQMEEDCRLRQVYARDGAHLPSAPR